MSDRLLDETAEPVLDAWKTALWNGTFSEYVDALIVPLTKKWQDFIAGDDPVYSMDGDLSVTVPVLMTNFLSFRDLMLAASIDPDRVDADFVRAQVTRPSSPSSRNAMERVLVESYHSPLTESAERRITRASQAFEAMGNHAEVITYKAMPYACAAYLAWWSCDGAAALNLGLRSASINDEITLNDLVLGAIKGAAYPHLVVDGMASAASDTAAMAQGVDPADPTVVSGMGPSAPTL